MKTTLDEMQLFVSVVALGSISAAADQLELTVSAASRTLTRLEHKLDTTLLNRTTRRLTLTDEGASFLEQARSILDSVNAAEEQMAARKHAPAGRLRVDAATPFMPPRRSCCTPSCPWCRAFASVIRTSSWN